MTDRQNDSDRQISAYLEENESVLTGFEENTVRMTQGLDESSDYELHFGVGASKEAKEKLANLEGFLVQMYENAQQLDKDAEQLFTEIEEETKQEVINSLTGKSTE